MTAGERKKLRKAMSDMDRVLDRDAHFDAITVGEVRRLKMRFENVLNAPSANQLLSEKAELVDDLLDSLAEIDAKAIEKEAERKEWADYYERFRAWRAAKPFNNRVETYPEPNPDEKRREAKKEAKDNELSDAAA